MILQQQGDGCFGRKLGGREALITVVEMAKYLRRKEKKVIWLWLVYGSADLGVSLCAYMQYGSVTMPYTSFDGMPRNEKVLGAVKGGFYNTL